MSSWCLNIAWHGNLITWYWLYLRLFFVFLSIGADGFVSYSYFSTSIQSASSPFDTTDRVESHTRYLCLRTLSYILYWSADSKGTKVTNLFKRNHNGTPLSISPLSHSVFCLTLPSSATQDQLTPVGSSKQRPASHHTEPRFYWA